VSTSARSPCPRNSFPSQSRYFFGAGLPSLAHGFLGRFFSEGSPFFFRAFFWQVFYTVSFCVPHFCLPRSRVGCPPMRSPHLSSSFFFFVQTGPRFSLSTPPFFASESLTYVSFLLAALPFCPFGDRVFPPVPPLSFPAHLHCPVQNLFPQRRPSWREAPSPSPLPPTPNPPPISFTHLPTLHHALLMGRGRLPTLCFFCPLEDPRKSDISPPPFLFLRRDALFFFQLNAPGSCCFFGTFGSGFCPRCKAADSATFPSLDPDLISYSFLCLFSFHSAAFAVPCPRDI